MESLEDAMAQANAALDYSPDLENMRMFLASSYEGLDSSPRLDIAKKATRDMIRFFSARMESLDQRERIGEDVSAELVFASETYQGHMHAMVRASYGLACEPEKSEAFARDLVRLAFTHYFPDSF